MSHIVDGLYVGPEVCTGNLDLRNTNIQSLGKLKVVTGGVYAFGASALCDLGCLEEVGEHLHIRGTNLRSLGSLKKVKGSLDAGGVHTLCDLGRLEGVDYLDISGTSISSLGRLKKVGTFFKLDGSRDFVTFEDFLEELDLLRSIPASDLSMYLYDPKYSHPLYQEALGRRS